MLVELQTALRESNGYVRDFLTAAEVFEQDARTGDVTNALGRALGGLRCGRGLGMSRVGGSIVARGCALPLASGAHGCVQYASRK